MFDDSLPGPTGLAGASDAEVIDAITGWSAAAAAAEARKFAALAEWSRRARRDPQRARWVCDDLDEAAAQVGCALTISHGRALRWLDTAETLRDRLPRLNNRFLAGHVSERVIARIVWQCTLVVDDTVWAALDEQFAAAATSWGSLSGDKLDTAIEVWIHALDPDAVRRARTRYRDRDFRIGIRDDATGTTTVSGRVGSLDAAIAAQRLAAMVASVCDADPRTLAQKRADAFGAVFAGVFELHCLCGDTDCPASQNPDARATSVVVHVVADDNAASATPDPALHGEHPRTQPTLDTSASPPPAARPAVIPGLPGTVVPAAVLADWIARGSTVRRVARAGALPASPGYRPSTALDEFVRARDLTCRVPGCDRPAIHADIDHITPWPAGLTHPANLSCKCRLHHLLKTFYDDWHQTQSPDGALQITTPTEHTYTTKPFSTLLFPTWTTTSSDPPGRPTPSPTPPRTPGRELKMPLRRHTRDTARANYITRERRLNAAQRELEDTTTQQNPAPPNKAPQPAAHPPDPTDDPPPF